MVKKRPIRSNRSQLPTRYRNSYIVDKPERRKTCRKKDQEKGSSAPMDMNEVEFPECWVTLEKFEMPSNTDGGAKPTMEATPSEPIFSNEFTSDEKLEIERGMLEVNRIRNKLTDLKVSQCSEVSSRQLEQHIQSLATYKAEAKCQQKLCSDKTFQSQCESLLNDICHICHQMKLKIGVIDITKGKTEFLDIEQKIAEIDVKQDQCWQRFLN